MDRLTKPQIIGVTFQMKDSLTKPTEGLTKKMKLAKTCLEVDGISELVKKEELQNKVSRVSKKFVLK